METDKLELRKRYVKMWHEDGDHKVHEIKSTNLEDALKEMEPFIRGQSFFPHMFKVDDSIVKDLVDYYFSKAITFAVHVSAHGRIFIVHYVDQIEPEMIFI